MADEKINRADGKSSGVIGAVTGAAGLLLFLGIIAVIVVYTGAYNVAATEDHASIVRWAFDTNMHNAVERRASEVDMPREVTPEMLEAGASSYKTMCEHCHAGPGAERAEWASGMRPRPPHLNEAAAEWQPNQIFWMVKHGIKMSGMPAFGPTHDDGEIWNIAAFVDELPAMTPERYESLGGATDGAGQHSDSQQH